MDKKELKAEIDKLKMETETNYDFDEIEVQLGESKEIRVFKKISNFKQSGSIGTIEFDFLDFDTKSNKKSTDGEYEFQYFTAHAELYGRVVSKIKRV